MVTTTSVTSAEASLVESGEQRDRIGRRITPAARRATLVAEWEASGQTQRAFARREGINYTTFAAWVQAARRSPDEPGPPRAKSPAVRFLAASLPAPAPDRGYAVCVRLPDGTELRGHRGRELAEVLRALRL